MNRNAIAHIVRTYIVTEIGGFPHFSTIVSNSWVIIISLCQRSFSSHNDANKACPPTLPKAPKNLTSVNIHKKRMQGTTFRFVLPLENGVSYDIFRISDAILANTIFDVTPLNYKAW